MEKEHSQDAPGNLPALPRIGLQPSDSKETAALYNATYYANYCGELPYARLPHWLNAFGELADRLVAHLQPKTALDAGCAMGFLVESLRDRGVDAHGVDLSAYALSQVRDDIKPYCREGSLTESLGGPYDLVTCIEVMEHLPPAEEVAALQRLTEASETILFSSTPEGADHPTHYNVQPMRHWLDRFAALGYFPDSEFDASFLAYQAFLLRRRTPSDGDYVAVYDELLRMRQDRIAKQAELAVMRSLNPDEWVALAASQAADTADAEKRIASPAELRVQLQVLETRLRAMESSIGWRLLTGYRRWLRNAIRARPLLARIYEPIANTILRVATGTSNEADTPKPESHASALIMEAATGGDVILHCEYPPADKRILAQGLFAMHGWAVARTGIDYVEAVTDGFPPVRAKRGEITPEIGLLFAEYQEADRAAFTCTLDVRKLPAGNRTVELVAHALDGTTAKLQRRVRVDHRDPYTLYQQREAAITRPAWVPSAEDPLISILTPVHKTPLPLIEHCVESVLRQSYPTWELCLVDDGSGDPELTARLEAYAREDRRIRVQTIGTNRGIAETTNACIEMATGSYVAFLDHDDELAPFALAEVVNAIRGEHPPDVVYSDEDKITPEGSRHQPSFKPGFSLDLLRSYNYICHFLVVRTELLRTAGGLRPGFEGSQDYDLVLRLAEATREFKRIPQILYHWRSTPGSTAESLMSKPAASQNGRRALEQHLQRVGLRAVAEEIRPGRYRVRHEPANDPEVLIVVPTGGNLPHLQKCISSVLTVTGYSNYRLCVADNSRDDAVEKHLKTIPDPRVTRLDFRGDPFNFARICNRAVANDPAAQYLFLNDDTEALRPNWLAAMAGHGSEPGVGVVGARLLYPDGRIQHAGVVLGIGGLAAHAFRLLSGDDGHYMELAGCTRNCAAVTGACLLTPREVFESVGGFDEAEFPVNLQDVDYCLKALKRGLRVVYEPEAELTHFESASRKRISATERELATMRERWQAWIEDDPFYNPNLTRHLENFSIRLD